MLWEPYSDVLVHILAPLQWILFFFWDDMGGFSITLNALNTGRLDLENPWGVEHVGAATRRGPERFRRALLHSNLALAGSAPEGAVNHTRGERSRYRDGRVQPRSSPSGHPFPFGFWKRLQFDLPSVRNYNGARS